jgi:hypothetical protein
MGMELDLDIEALFANLFDESGEAVCIDEPAIERGGTLVSQDAETIECEYIEVTPDSARVRLK